MRGRNLKEMLSPSLYPTIKRDKGNSITSCNRCDICKHFLVCKQNFTCKVTGKSYGVRGFLNSERSNVVYLISCTNCGDQYVGSARNFKNRFRVHKSDINANKDRCGTARHFNIKCCHPDSPFAFLSV